VTSLAADNFNRADGALGTSSSGHVWTHTGWTVASNVARPPAVADYRFATLDGGQADVDVTTTIIPSVSSAANDMGLAARVVDSNNLLIYNFACIAGVWLCRAYQRVGGSFTGITSSVNPVPELGNSDFRPFRARMLVEGDAGEVFCTTQDDLVTWHSQGTFSGIDGGLLAATAHGLFGNDTDESGFDGFDIDGESTGPEEKDGSDVGRLAEAYTLLRRSSGADTGRLVDVVQSLLVLQAQRTDAGRLAEAAGLVVALAAADAGRGADTRLTLAAGVGGSDSGRSAESVAAAATLARSDAGSWASSVSISAQLAAADLARLVDVGTLVATGLQMLAASDSGRMAELADVVVLGLDHGHITDRSTVRSRVTDRTVTRSRALVRGLN
jgi:hypothetical protein